MNDDIPETEEDENLDALHPAIRALRVICRCNNVKYKTIEKAVLGGARTINDVAARTSATTGYCGGTCTPKVQKMIETLAPPAVKQEAADPDAWWVRKK
jgi:NAD(P)H-nitrite reductase large subunit